MNILVRPTDRHLGTLRAFDETHACALGRTGVVRDKREGDGATPAGTFTLRAIRYRNDRVRLPRIRLPAYPIGRADGWCDDPGDPGYNRPVRLPHTGSAERLWREDGLYDLLIVVGHNDSPTVAGCGSAIFIHVASDELGPTDGCIALPRDILIDLVGRISPATRLDIRSA